MHGFSSKMNENRKVEMWCRHQKHLGIMLLEDSVCLLLRRFDSEAGEAGELEARETGDEHARDHGKEKEERRNACKNSCRFLANFVVFLARYFSRVFKP